MSGPDRRSGSLNSSKDANNASGNDNTTEAKHEATTPTLIGSSTSAESDSDFAVMHRAFEHFPSSLSHKWAMFDDLMVKNFPFPSKLPPLPTTGTSKPTDAVTANTASGSTKNDPWAPKKLTHVSVNDEINKKIKLFQYDITCLKPDATSTIVNTSTDSKTSSNTVANVTPTPTDTTTVSGTDKKVDGSDYSDVAIVAAGNPALAGCRAPGHCIDAAIFIHAGM